MNRGLLYVFVFLVAISSQINGQSNQYHFNKIDNNNGLSHNHVGAILKDSRGFMWFGTSNGLNRFDGYSVKTFKNIPGDSTSIINNSVFRLYEDKEGILWIETMAGLCKYDSKYETFDSKNTLFKDKFYIPQVNLSNVVEDKEGNSWLAHISKGLYKYTQKKNCIELFEHNTNDPSSISTNYVSSIGIDTGGYIWIIHTSGVLEKIDPKSDKVIERYPINVPIGISSLIDYQLFIDEGNNLWLFSKSYQVGLYYFITKTKEFKHFHTNSSRYKTNNNLITSIVQANNGDIWCGTDHGGINVIDLKNFSTRYIMNVPYNENSLSQDVILKLYKDSEGIIWVGTYKKGVNYYHESFNKFKLVNNNPLDPNSLPYNDINCFTEDDKNNLWIGTNGEGLICYNRNKKQYYQYKNDPSDPNSISSNVIVSLLFDSDNRLWIGTFHGGLNVFENNSFKKYKQNSSKLGSISSNHVWKIIEDSKNNIWIGTLGGGVNLFNPGLNSFTQFKSNDFNSVQNDVVFTLYEDSKNNIWIGTGNGLDKYNLLTGRFINYRNEVNNPSSLSNNHVFSICEDNFGNLWIGTGNGLNLLKRNEEKFCVIDQSNGLTDNVILTITKDNDGSLWLTTTNGITKIVITRDTVSNNYSFAYTNYDKSDGLQGKAFNEGAAFKTKDGFLLFGGANGFNICNPDEIKAYHSNSIVTITDFQIFNKSIKRNEKINGRILLNKSISYMDKLKLKFKENVISFEFTALNYFHPEKRRYMYILEGFNSEWLEADINQRKATYTNLNPGEYVFRVKATDNSGKWSPKEASIKLIISPPWWFSGYALISYIVFLVIGFVVIRKTIINRVKSKRNIEIERIKAKNIHESDMMKLRFFTNISHEFKTPLTLIIAPLEKIINTLNDEKINNQLKLVYNNSVRMLKLINQLMDFRKLEAGSLKLQVSNTDIVNFIKKIADSFNFEAKERNIDFSVQSKSPELECWFDIDKMEKILYNLISNAFKFTPDYGRIALKVKSKIDENLKNTALYHHLEISVENTGMGIPKENLKKVFDRFYQVKDSQNKGGTGIGLTLTKEMVELHQGTISVHSIPGKLTKFNVCIPLDNKYFEKYEVIKEKTEKEYNTVKEFELNKTKNVTGHDKSVLENLPIMLVVEDHNELRMFIKNEFAVDFNIIEAGDGMSGMEKAYEAVPDIIISDIIMPKLSGIELCQKLKNNELTSHIPIILLTSQSDEHNIIEGYETGADDYITKPFSIDVLKARVKNILNSRKKLQEQYKNTHKIPLKAITPTSLDQKFLAKMAEIVEENIGNSEFDANDFAHKINMSRAQLYRKMKSLTGFSVNEYIRNIRLNKAVELLTDKNFNVNEAAFAVGFNQVTYFTKCFTEYYGVSPTKYVQMNK